MVLNCFNRNKVSVRFITMVLKIIYTYEYIIKLKSSFVYLFKRANATNYWFELTKYTFLC